MAARRRQPPPRSGPIPSDVSRLVLRFALAIAVLAIVRVSGLEAPVSDVVCRGIASAVGVLLTPIVSGVRVANGTVSAPAGDLRVGPECSGFDVIGLLGAAIAAYPLEWRRRLVGVLVMVPFILALNVIRVSSLLLLLGYGRQLFDFGHTFAWQGILILASVGYWVLWSSWAHEPSRR